ELVQTRRQPELLERPDLLRDLAERAADGVALEIDVDAEAGDSRDEVREVDLAVDLEALLLLRVEDPVEDFLRPVGFERLDVRQRHELAVHAHDRRRSDRDVEVGRAERRALFEKLVDGKRLGHDSNELSAAARPTFTVSTQGLPVARDRSFE